MCCLKWLAQDARDPGPWGWEILKAVVIPVLVAIVSLYLANVYQTLREQDQEVRKQAVRAQQEATTLSQLTISKDRDNASKLLAIASRLDVHLERYRRSRAELQQQSDPQTTNTTSKQVRIEEAAAFFFYGLLRAKATDFNTSGSIVFSRPWLSDVFELSLASTIETLAGGNDYDIKVPIEDDAVIYWVHPTKAYLAV